MERLPDLSMDPNTPHQIRPIARGDSATASALICIPALEVKVQQVKRS